MNETIEKFGYPATLVREYDHWVVLLRPAQVTAGSLVLAAKSEATAFADIPPAAFAEQAVVIADIERMLRRSVGYEKINYLMLMMVDRHVHFHVFPRYGGDRSLAGMEFADTGWPGIPDLKSAKTVEKSWTEEAVRVLRSGD